MKHTTAIRFRLTRPAVYGLNTLISSGAALALMFSLSLHNGAGAASGVTPVVPSVQAVAMQSTFEQVAERTRPSVVFVRCLHEHSAPVDYRLAPDESPYSPDAPDTPEGDPRPFSHRPGGRLIESSGSGVVIRSDGWILTNDHVVAGADRIQVRLQDGRELEGRVVRDFTSDLALIKVEATGLPVAEFADSDQLKIGEWAIAFGAPFGLNDTMTVGIVSALDRQKTIGTGREGRFYNSLIQTDASTNPGNSGGPLVDIFGRIIGIDVAIESPSGASAGIGFAIPANTARYIADQLMETGHVTRGFLGLVPGTPTYEEQQRAGAVGGAMVRAVTANSPAQRAGICVGDLILRYNNQTVTGESHLRNLVMCTRPGQQVTVVVKRNEGEQTLTLTPAPVPETPDDGAFVPDTREQPEPDSGAGDRQEPDRPEGIPFLRRRP